MVAENDGLKGSAAQFAASKRLEGVAVAPSVLVIDEVTCISSQLVGLNVNSLRLMSTLIVLTSSGTPSRIVGSGSLVIVSAPVFGFTAIDARVTSFSKPYSPLSVNGPAVVGSTIERPNGWWSYELVR